MSGQTISPPADQTIQYRTLRGFAQAVAQDRSLLGRLHGLAEHVCLSAAEHYVPLELIPEENRTLRVCVAAVRCSGANLDFVPDCIKDDAFYIRMIRNFPEDLGREFFIRIPKHLLNRDICSTAVQAWDVDLRDIPQEFADADMAALACREDRIDLSEVPAGELTEGIVLDNLEKSNNAYDFLALPESMKTERTYLAAAKCTCNFKLSDVPEGMRTADMYLISIINGTCDVDISRDMAFTWPLSSSGNHPRQPRTMMEFNRLLSDDPTVLWRVEGLAEKQAVRSLLEHPESLRFLPPEKRTAVFWEKLKQFEARLYAALPLEMRSRLDDPAGDVAYIPQHLSVESLSSVPEEDRTRETCLSYVEKTAVNLKYVPEGYLDGEMYETASLDCAATEWIPEKAWTRTVLFNTALCSSSFDLRADTMPMDEPFSPYRIKEPAAFYRQPKTMLEFRDVFREHPEIAGRLTDVSDAVFDVLTSWDNRWVIGYMPDFMALSAIKRNPKLLACFPEHLKTKGICCEAVKGDGRLLYYVPKHMRTYEMCLEAVSQHGDCLAYVPKALRTYELCYEAIKRTHALVWTDYVPTSLWDEKMVLRGVSACGYSIAYLPEILKTEEVCRAAVLDDNSNGDFFEFVPEKYKTQELCLLALFVHVFAAETIAQFIPEDIPFEPYFMV